MSIEQNNSFHIARRILKQIAPEYRVFATQELGPGDCVLDVKRQTVEVGENTTTLQAVGAILFQVGHLRLRHNPLFMEHFGQLGQLQESIALKKVIRQGVLADKLATEWALQTFLANFKISLAEAESILSGYSWNESEWKTYYESNI